MAFRVFKTQSVIDRSINRNKLYFYMRAVRAYVPVDFLIPVDQIGNDLFSSYNQPPGTKQRSESVYSKVAEHSFRARFC